MLDKFAEQVLDVMNEYSFMINHEKKKIKEVSRTIKRIIKINENTENKIDLEVYIKDRDEHLKNLTELKQDAKKINRIYKILMKSEE